MLLILLAVMIQLIASCPSSCLVCSDDITLCQGLTYILAVPASTKTLIITDGSINSVEGFNLSFLLNATLLRLSTNGITTIRDDAFLGLRMLKTLLLDQNQISTSTITYSTFHELQKLQVLVLSNNILSTIHGIWFRNLKDLIKLNLNGNQLTSITGNSFEMANLSKLRILDLSNNFINSIEKRAFHGLTQLMEIDLSRNRLAVIPDMFSSLTQLSYLNLDQNWWNCTCKLYDLTSFLRKFMNSSSRTLRNADNMSCRTSENPSVINLLELTEVNCKNALKRPHGVLTNQRTNYRRDFLLVAVFSFLGGVGLTCLVLSLFNRKLQHSKANECSPENCCCRTLDECQCGCESRNYLTKGYCNCQLTRENEIKVMSMPGNGRDMTLLHENNYQEGAKAESKYTDLEMPVRNTEKRNEQMKNDNFSCLNCALLQSCLRESSGNKGIRSGTLCGRCSRPVCLLANKRLGKHVANEWSHSPFQTEDKDYSKTQKQQHFIPALSYTTSTPKELKGHCMVASLENCGSQQNDKWEVLERNLNSIPCLDDFPSCKCIDGDKYQENLIEKKHNCEKKIMLENKVKSRRVGGCCMSDGEGPLSPAVRRMYQPQSVSFYVPDLERIKKGDIMISGLNKMRTLENKKQCEYIQQKPSSVPERRLFSKSEGRNEERKSSFIPAGPDKKEKKLIQKQKIKTKRQEPLNVKLDLCPFRKTRVYPEELHPKESREQCQCCQNIKLPCASKKEETRKKRKTKSDYPVATKGTSRSRKEMVYSRAVVGKLPEETGKITAPSIPDSSNNSAMRNTEDILLAKDVGIPGCISKTTPPKGNSRMHISVPFLLSENLPNISQNIVNNIPIPVNSKEDATEMVVLPFHPEVATEKDHNLSPPFFIPSENLELQDDLQPQQISEDTMQNKILHQIGHQQLKRYEAKPSMQDRSDLLKEFPQENAASILCHRFGEILSSNGHQIPTEKDISTSKSPGHLSEAFSDSQVNECRTKDIEEHEPKIRQMTVGLKPESTNESSKRLASAIARDSSGLKTEDAEPVNEWENNQYKTVHKNIVKMTISSNESSIPSSPKTGNTQLDSNIILEVNDNIPKGNDSDLQDALNNQFDEGSSEHKEGKMPPATHQEFSLSPQFKDINCEEQTESSLLPCNINEAEIAVPGSTATDFNEELSLQAEQCKANISNNTYPLIIFKDKKPLSI